MGAVFKVWDRLEKLEQRVLQDLLRVTYVVQMEYASLRMLLPYSSRMRSAWRLISPLSSVCAVSADVCAARAEAARVAIAEQSRTRHLRTQPISGSLCSKQHSISVPP